MRTQVITLLLSIFLLSAFGAYSEEEALKLLFVSKTSYCQASLIMSKTCGIGSTKLGEYSITPVFALDNDKKENGITMGIYQSDQEKRFYVGFSGTREAVQLVTEIAESFPKKYDIHPEVEGAKVMDYFYQRYVKDFREAFLEKIQGLVKQNPGYGITFTGHSLGGAMTVHAAADFILSGLGENHDVQVYTFGQPRVGNHEFVDSFIDKISEFYRVTHNKDIVPHIPPCVSNLKHSCQKDGILPFYPYHASQEIWYNEDSTSFTVCDAGVGEDPNCSDQHVNESTGDHTYYLGHCVSCRNRLAVEDLIKTTL